MPVIYLSVAQPKSPLDMRCHVESITRRGANGAPGLVQTLELDTAGWAMTRAPTLYSELRRGSSTASEEICGYSPGVCAPCRLLCLHSPTTNVATLPPTIALRRQYVRLQEPTMYSNR